MAIIIIDNGKTNVSKNEIICIPTPCNNAKFYRKTFIFLRSIL